MPDAQDTQRLIDDAQGAVVLDATKYATQAADSLSTSFVSAVTSSVGGVSPTAATASPSSKSSSQNQSKTVWLWFAVGIIGILVAFMAAK